MSIRFWYNVQTPYSCVAGLRIRAKACENWDNLGRAMSLVMELALLCLVWVETVLQAEGNAFRSSTRILSGRPGGGTQGRKVPWVLDRRSLEERLALYIWCSNQHNWQDFLLEPIGQFWLESTSCTTCKDHSVWWKGNPTFTVAIQCISAVSAWTLAFEVPW